MKKLRVIVDFQKNEQMALQALCQADYRLPDDQIRWLIVNAAHQRGLCTTPTNNNTATKIDQTERSGVA